MEDARGPLWGGYTATPGIRQDRVLLRRDRLAGSCFGRDDETLFVPRILPSVTGAVRLRSENNGRRKRR